MGMSGRSRPTVVVRRLACADEPATVREREAGNDTQQLSYANAVISVRDGVDVRHDKLRRSEAFEDEVLRTPYHPIVSFKCGLAWTLDANGQMVPMSDDERDFYENELVNAQRSEEAAQSRIAEARSIMDARRTIAPLRVRALNPTMNRDCQGLLPGMELDNGSAL